MCPSIVPLWDKCIPLGFKCTTIRQEIIICFTKHELQDIVDNFWDRPFQGSGSEYVLSDEDASISVQSDESDLSECDALQDPIKN